MSVNPLRKALVVGGSSGLGLAIARSFVAEGYEVFITGRHDPKEKNLNFLYLEVTADTKKISSDLDSIINTISSVNLLIYAAGFFEEGKLGELSESHIIETINIGMSTPALVVSKLLRREKKLEGVIFITSTSQWIPRLKEPVYAAAKAGLGMLGSSLSLDPAIGKTLIVGPGALDTSFWKGPKRSGTLLDPEWVAEEILRQYKNAFTYKVLRITRDPRTVEVVEERNA